MVIEPEVRVKQLVGAYWSDLEVFGRRAGLSRPIRIAAHKACDLVFRGPILQISSAAEAEAGIVVPARCLQGKDIFVGAELRVHGTQKLVRPNNVVFSDGNGLLPKSTYRQQKRETQCAYQN